VVPNTILAYELLGITVKTASRTAAPHFPASTAAKRSGQGSWYEIRSVHQRQNAWPDSQARLSASALAGVLAFFVGAGVIISSAVDSSSRISATSTTSLSLETGDSVVVTGSSP